MIKDTLTFREPSSRSHVTRPAGLLFKKFGGLLFVASLLGSGCGYSKFFSLLPARRRKKNQVRAEAIFLRILLANNRWIGLGPLARFMGWLRSLSRSTVKSVAVAAPTKRRMGSSHQMTLFASLCRHDALQ